MKENKVYPRKPNKILMAIGYCLIWPFLISKYKIKVHNKDLLKSMRTPYVLISNHGAAIDPLFIAGAIYPSCANFVGGYAYFNNKKINWFLKQIGAIPKFQYQTDLIAMRKMLGVIKNGGILGLFPAGRMPSCGAGFPIPPSLAKLLKLCKANVIVATIHGSYLSKPKWAVSKRRGRVDISFEHLYTPEQVKEINVDLMIETLNKKLDFNDYEWQKEQMIPYKGKKLAEKLETTLYRCPKCESEFKMESKGNVLKCLNCGETFEVKETGYFACNPYFEHPQKWYEWQRISIQEFIANSSFIFEDKTEVRGIIDNVIDKIGEGVIQLTNQGFHYIGLLDNIKVDLVIPIDNLFSLPYRAGANFEIAYNERVLQFWLEHGNAAVKWSLLVEEIYKKKQHN